MKAKLVAVVAALIATLRRVDQWLGRQTYLTLREIHELGFSERLEQCLDARGADRAQLGFQTIIAAIVVVVAVMLSVVILDQMNSSITITNDYQNASAATQNLSDSRDSVLSGFGDMASLVAPLLLVAIAVVIIGLLRRVS